MMDPEDSAHTLLRARQAYAAAQRLTAPAQHRVALIEGVPFMIDPDGSVHELIEGEVIRCA